MKLALDTNRYIDLVASIEPTVRLVRRADAVFLPFIVLGELRGGILCGNRVEENKTTLAHFLSSPRVSVLYADEETTHYYGRYFAQLKKQGTLIPTNDIWIAALVSQHNLLLHSRDSHFDHLPQLARI